MTLTYKPRPSIVSPFQNMRKKSSDAFNVQDSRSPVRKELLKAIGSHNFRCELSEDVQALALFKKPGLIAFVATISRGNSGEVLGQGRGVAIIDSSNRYFVKAIQAAASAALVDSMVKSTKLFNLLDTVAITTDKAVPETTIGEAYQAKESDGFEPVSKNQRDYLQQLIQINIESGSERDRLISEIEEMSRSEASSAIQSYVNPR